MESTGLSPSTVVVVGAGISGVAAARELVAAGLDVVLLERGMRVGGRMARWTRDGRAVDVGAAYFTIRDLEFRQLAEQWATRGLAHPWTDTFTVANAAGVHDRTVGPVRWSAEKGLRSLVEDLADGLDVRVGVEVERVGAGPSVDGRPVRAVVLAMPDPQALDLVGDDLPGVRSVLRPEWDPVITVAASFPRRTWRGLDAMFVHDSPLTLVVDDGRRRGDGAPVLVAHTTHEVARAHLDEPSAVVPEVLAEVERLVPVEGPPTWVEAKRWGSATPHDLRPERYWLTEERVALCGDGWSMRPRVEAAWLSGRDAGRGLAAQLARE